MIRALHVAPRLFGRGFASFFAAVLFWVCLSSAAFGQKLLPDIDTRPRLQPSQAALQQRKQATTHLEELAPDAEVAFDPVIGSAKWVHNKHGFLSGRNGG